VNHHLDVEVAAPENGDAQLKGLHHHLALLTLAGGNMQQHHLGHSSVGQTRLVEQQFLLFHFLLLQIIFIVKTDRLNLK